MEKHYTVTIHWTYDDSVSVHHFYEYDDALKFWHGAYDDAMQYADAHSVILKFGEDNLRWHIFKY